MFKVHDGCDYIKFATAVSVGRMVKNTLRCQRVLMMQWVLGIQEVKSFSILHLCTGCPMVASVWVSQAGMSNPGVSPLQTWKSVKEARL